MIIVSGASGQLGKCLEDQNKNFHHDLLFTSRNEFDITSERMVRDFIARHHPSAIINCAAYTLVDQAESELTRALQVNAQAPGFLALLCQELSIPLIHFSTDYVFDGRKRIPYKESDQCYPINVYAQSKFEGESKILETNIKGAILRTSWLYSEHAPNFLMTMRRLASTHPQISVVGDQFGQPTYAGELARYVLKHLELLCAQKIDLYHFSNIGETTWFDFATEILKDSETVVKKIKSSEWKSAAKRSPYSVLDCHKLEELTGEPMISWEEGLKLCLANLS